MSIAEDLKRLADLHAAGDLTDAEYSRAKERHLARGTAPSSSGALLGGVGLAVILLLVSIFGVGILAAIAIPNFVEMQLRAKRAELPANVEGIRTAELAAYAASGAYIAVPELAPRPLDELDKLQVDWVEATAFDALGWRPDGRLRGTYSVELNDQGFVVHGYIDVDGDGVPAYFRATADEPASMQSTSDTY